jgi:hypothetical protein
MDVPRINSITIFSRKLFGIPGPFVAATTFSTTPQSVSANRKLPGAAGVSQYTIATAFDGADSAASISIIQHVRSIFIA